MITINVKCTALLLLIVLLGLVSKTTSQAAAPAPATAPTNSNCQLMPSADLTNCVVSILQVRGIPAVPVVPPPCTNAITMTAVASRIIGPSKTCVCFRQMLASIASTLGTSPSVLASSLSSLLSQISLPRPRPMNLGFSLDSNVPCP